MMGAYIFCLAAFAAIGAFRRNHGQLWTPLVMLANWGACQSVVSLTGDFYPVLFFGVADYMSAMAIFVVRRSHWQSAVMAIYGVQLVCHAAYGMSDMGLGPTYYSYWALTYLGWAQLAVVGGWIGIDLIGRWIAISSRRRVQTSHFAMVSAEKE